MVAVLGVRAIPSLTAIRIVLANVLHICKYKYYVTSNLQSVVAAFRCNTFIYVFVTLSPTVSGVFPKGSKNLPSYPQG